MSPRESSDAATREPADAPGQATELRFSVSPRAGDVSALLVRPLEARALVVLGHGAGAGMRHPFMEAVAHRLAARDLATLRYQFPYMEQGQRRPSPRPQLLATVRAALSTAHELAGELPVLAGGKSMGGRMTSLALAEKPEPRPRALVFLGFPLHPAGRPGTERAAHLSEADLPMLFLQGTRDRLAELDLLRPICADLGPRAELRVIEGADHSFHVLKRSGRNDAEVLDELADAIAAWTARVAS